jgi:hypothetical protein
MSLIGELFKAFGKEITDPVSLFVMMFSYLHELWVWTMIKNAELDKDFE